MGEIESPEKRPSLWAPKEKRPRWLNLLLWALFAVFTALLLREIVKVFGDRVTDTVR